MNKFLHLFYQKLQIKKHLFMLNQKTYEACSRFPANQMESCLYYPGIALYSVVDSLVRTVVGCIFTVLSLASLGLYPRINELANWTCYSTRIATFPLQIIGNIFNIHSEILQDYNISRPIMYASTGIAIDMIKSPNNYLDKAEQQLEEEIKNRVPYLLDFQLTEVEGICSQVFQVLTENKRDWIGKLLFLEDAVL